MASQTITIDKSELKTLIRGIVKEEIKKANTISLQEQKELEKIYGQALYEEDHTYEKNIRL